MNKDSMTKSDAEEHMHDSQQTMGGQSPESYEVIFQHRRGDQFMILFGILFLWPLLAPIGIVSWTFNHFGKVSRFARMFPPILIFLPFSLIMVSKQNRARSLLLGVVLLLPLLVFAMLDIILPAAVMGHESLVPPTIRHIFGTDGLGRDIFLMLIKGSLNIYIITLLATILSVSIGVYLGLQSIRPNMDTPVLAVVQFIESIPSLVWILMMLTAYSLWQTSMNPLSSMHVFSDSFRPVVIGFLIGICFIPNIYRMIRDKVKYLALEEFIDMTRAHGISLKRIQWVHLLRNTLPDLMIVGGSLPGLAILTLLNIDYFFSISSFQIGAARYASWTQMLLTPETTRALLFYDNLWLVIPPALLIILTTVGCYLYGSGLRAIRKKNDDEGLLTNSDSYFQKALDGWTQN